MDHSVMYNGDSSLLEVSNRRSQFEHSQIRQTSQTDSTSEYLGGLLQSNVYNGFFTDSENLQSDVLDTSNGGKCEEHVITHQEKENLNFESNQLAGVTYDDISEENETNIYSECPEFGVDFDEFSRRIDNTDISHVVASEDYLVDFLQYKMNNGRFEDVIKTLKQISCVTDPRFLQFWDEAHYMLHQQFTEGELTSLQKHRIRKRNEPPAGICIGGKRPTLRMSESARAVLNGWYKEHVADPYPSRKKKRELSARAGITLSQVNTWFSNARRNRRHRRRQFSSLTKPSNVASTAKNEVATTKNEPLLGETSKINRIKNIQRQRQIQNALPRSMKDNNNDQISMVYNAPTTTAIHAGESVTQYPLGHFHQSQQHTQQCEPLVWQMATHNTYNYGTANQTVLGGGAFDRSCVPTANTNHVCNYDESPYPRQGSMLECNLGICRTFQDADTQNTKTLGTRSKLNFPSTPECCPSAINSLLSLRRLCDTLEDSVTSPLDFAKGVYFDQQGNQPGYDQYRGTQNIQTGVSMETSCTPISMSKTLMTSSISQLPSPIATMSSSTTSVKSPMAPITPFMMTAFTPGRFASSSDVSLSSRVPWKPFTLSRMAYPLPLTAVPSTSISVTFPTASFIPSRRTDPLPWAASSSTSMPVALPMAFFTPRRTDFSPWTAVPSTVTSKSVALPMASFTPTRITDPLPWNAAPSSRVAVPSPMSSYTSLSTSSSSPTSQWTRIIDNSPLPCFANIANRPLMNISRCADLSDLYACSDYPMKTQDATSSKHRMPHDHTRHVGQYVGQATTFTSNSKTTLPSVYHDDQHENRTQDPTNLKGMDVSLLQLSGIDSLGAFIVNYDSNYERYVLLGNNVCLGVFLTPAMALFIYTKRQGLIRYDSRRSYSRSP